MEITFKSVPSWNEEQVFLHVNLDPGEVIKKGMIVSIPLLDGSVKDVEVAELRPKGSERDKGVPDEFTYEDGYCEFAIEGLPYHDIADRNSLGVRKWQNEHASDVCITPFEELSLGKESIHNHIDMNLKVDEKVIAYLKTESPYLVCPGIYEHPFKKGVNLLGPYVYTDGHFFWDRDTWKYVVKYGLVLPQEFIDHVMSDAGTEYLEEYYEDAPSWKKRIAEWKESGEGLCLLPDNAGDMDLEDF